MKHGRLTREEDVELGALDDLKYRNGGQPS